MLELKLIVRRKMFWIAFPIICNCISIIIMIVASWKSGMHLENRRKEKSKLNFNFQVKVFFWFSWSWKPFEVYQPLHNCSVSPSTCHATVYSGFDQWLFEVLRLTNLTVLFFCSTSVYGCLYKLLWSSACYWCVAAFNKH